MSRTELPPAVAGHAGKDGGKQTIRIGDRTAEETVTGGDELDSTSSTSLEACVTARLRELEGENIQLQEALRSHAVVDQAIGVVLALGGLTPHEGWHVLRTISQRTNIKLRNVAELVIEWARTEELPPDIRNELERQLARIPGHRQADM